MKRKVIQIADSTQLISLPRKWCLEHGIKKGDELEVIEDQSRIIVKVSNDKNEPERVTINATGLEYSVRTLVSSIYKSGYDEFKIFFSSAKELQHIQTIVKDSCLGFEIVEQGKDYVVARKISEPIPEEFDPVLRRTFVFLQHMMRETLIAVKNNDTNALNTIIAMDANINKLTYFCRRVLNKHGKGPYRITSPLYYIVDELEEIADRYKYICRARLEHRGPIDKQLMHVFDKVNHMVDTYIHAFYKFDWDKINEIYAIKKSIDLSIPELIKKIDKQNFPILLNLLVIADKIHELDGPLTLTRYEPIIGDVARS